MHLTQMLKICIIIQECICESQIFIFWLILSVAFSSCTVIMPSHVYNLDGTPAYETWSGGWLGVMNKQLEDLDDMMEKLVP